MADGPLDFGYDLLRDLGGGELTRVFQARDPDSGDLVAVKFLRDQWADDPTAVKLLQREARAGMLVRHPAFAQVREARVTAPPYYLVLDWVPGETAGLRLRRDFKLDARVAYRVARQTAEALRALHRAGFIHGDIKPDNLLLTDAGGLMVLDLGFAHRPGENDRLYAAGYRPGTAAYLAPELCGDVPTASVKSDLFSLGVVLVELLTGERPWPAGSVAETLDRHLHDPPTGLAELPPFVATLLDHRPERRPSSSVLVQELISWEITALRRAG